MAMTPGYRMLTAFIVATAFALPVYLLNIGILGDFFHNSPDNPEIILISVVIFGDIYLGFVAYWMIRNLFSKRWAILNSKLVNSRIFRFPIDEIISSELPENHHNNILSILDINSDDFSITKYPKSTSLQAEIIYPKYNDKKAIVFYCHGFNDSSKKIRYKTYALAELGYTIFVWDARGMGNSSKAGIKGNFIARNIDAATIVEYFLNIPYFQDYKFAIIGESMGGICAAYVLNQFPDRIDKCILISTPSIFNETFPRNVVPFSKKSIQRFNYRVKGINPYPEGKTNKVLSPYLLFQNLQYNYSDNEWRKYTNIRFLLIHSITDGLISYNKCEQNASVLQLNPENILTFQSGNHNQIRNEIGIISAIDRFLQK